MCGIYGFASADGDLGDARDIARILLAMDRSIVHRGPDDSGSFTDGSCAMGMRRLSIIDLESGRQPISCERERVHIVFNGEIYNYRALREQCSRRGHIFKTATDTEVLIHLYEQKREALVDDLDGMFGFAIWDQDEETLLLGRDRLGIKPLYYSITPDAIVFGSELKSLLFHPGIRRDLDLESLSYYLSFGTSSPEQSCLRNVRKLPPGHVLRYHRGCVQISRYWDLSHAPAQNISERDAVHEVSRHIRDAVQSHLVADVPVGAFLSGGIDSATIVAWMHKLGVRPKTFSIGFDEPDFDELAEARAVAKYFETDHHELVVRPDVWALTEALAWQLDEPIADVSAIPTYLVSQLAAQEVKVVLSGDGGDEVFAGYERYSEALREARRFDWLPDLGRSFLRNVSAQLPESALGKHYLRHAGLDPRVRYIDGQMLFPPDLKADLVGERLRGRVHDTMESRARYLSQNSSDALSGMQRLDVSYYLPLDILTKVDRMSMAHSLEVRPPLLDHHLVEFMFGLPSHFKLRGNTQKWILKRAARDLLPEFVIRRPKRGFGVPIVRWFRGALRDPVRTLLSDRVTRERGLFSPRFVDALCDEHFRGRRDHALQLWSLVIFELWCRRVLDSTHPHLAATCEAAHA